MIREEGWIVHIELGGELLDVAGVVERALPLLLDALEEPVWVIVFAALELYHPLRMLTNQETNDVSRTAIMSAEKVAVFLRQLVVSSHEIGQALLIQSANRLR